MLRRRPSCNAAALLLLDHYRDPAESIPTPPSGIVIGTSGLMPNRMLVERAPGHELEVGLLAKELDFR